MLCVGDVGYVGCGGCGLWGMWAVGHDKPFNQEYML